MQILHQLTFWRENRSFFASFNIPETENVGQGQWTQQWVQACAGQRAMKVEFQRSHTKDIWMTLRFVLHQEMRQFSPVSVH